MKWLRSAYDWMGSKVHTPSSILWLIGFFVIESSIFPIPVDPLLILFCLNDQKKSWRFAAIATLASVAGGIVGYGIGAFLWHEVGDWFLRWVIAPQTFASIVERYRLYQNWAVVIAGFTPIPYKAVTLSAGFCHLELVPFIGYSLLARGARFFMIAGAIWMWGQSIKSMIDRYFDCMVILFAAIVIGSTMLLRVI